jgi:hypothetical protein
VPLPLSLRRVTCFDGLRPRLRDIMHAIVLITIRDARPCSSGEVSKRTSTMPLNGFESLVLRTVATRIESQLYTCADPGGGAPVRAGRPSVAEAAEACCLA